MYIYMFLKASSTNTDVIWCLAMCLLLGPEPSRLLAGSWGSRGAGRGGGSVLGVVTSDSSLGPRKSWVLGCILSIYLSIYLSIIYPIIYLLSIFYLFIYLPTSIYLCYHLPIVYILSIHLPTYICLSICYLSIIYFYIYLPTSIYLSICLSI